MENKIKLGAQEIYNNDKRILYLNLRDEFLKQSSSENLLETIVYAIDVFNHMAFIEPDDEALFIYDFTDTVLEEMGIDEFVKGAKIIGKKIKRCAFVGSENQLEMFEQYKINAIEKYPQLDGRFSLFNDYNEALEWIIK